MFRGRIGWVAALAVALGTTQAFAQPREGERDGGRGERGERREGDRGSFRFPNPLLDALDTNRDGELSADEINKAVASLKAMDKNGDGKVAGDEIRPPRPQFGGGNFTFNREDFVNRMLENDKNKDGKLAKDEVSERMRDGFDRMDTNGDGFIDKAEIEAMAARFGQGNRGRDGNRGDGDRRRGDGNRDGENRPRRPVSDDEL